MLRSVSGYFLSALPAIAGFALTLGLAPLASRAEILDAETEALLHSYAAPLIEAAGQPPGSIRVLIEGSPQVNAFALPGLVQVNSELFLRSQAPEEIQGIIAHEIAHIALAHFPVRRRAREGGVLITLASVLLGVGAVLAGQPEGAILAPAAALHIARSSELSVSRTTESAADSAALTYMDRAGISGRGLINFFRREFASEIRLQEEAYRTRISPYVVTHPLPRERLQALEARVSESPYAGAEAPPGLQHRHRMVQAKLFAFLRGSGETLARYPLDDESQPARYAHVLMFSKERKLKKALERIDGLIAEEPSNPFFHELKGYVFSRAGLYEEAGEQYEKSVALAPENALLQLAVGEALVLSEDEGAIRRALPYLKLAGARVVTRPYAHRHLAVAYDRLRRPGMAALAQAEALSAETERLDELYRLGASDQARDAIAQYRVQTICHTSRALLRLPAGNRVGRLRAQDIDLVNREQLERFHPRVFRRLGSELKKTCFGVG